MHSIIIFLFLVFFQENPVKLLEHVSEIRQQYNALVADAREIEKAQNVSWHCTVNLHNNPYKIVF